MLRQVAILNLAFMPAAAARLLDLLAVPASQRDFGQLGGGQRIAHGTALPAPMAVFPRYVDSEGSAQG